ncbi:MAG TPA: N-acetyltransferase [Fimbriiglobus sp.]|jgi:putative acetyltransferase|nr:N-acetyltransferase [Fimbriiglobus sp.]
MSHAIRPEQPGDASAVRRVHESAFPTPVEADLVDALRANGDLWLSLVAVDGWEVVGHVAFSPVTVNGEEVSGMGLAPVAVHPDRQKQGLGTRLTMEGLSECRSAGLGFVVVLGWPAYYSRFGFRPAASYGLTSVYDAGDAFQVLELRPGGLPDSGGLVRYAAPFDALGGASVG